MISRETAHLVLHWFYVINYHISSFLTLLKNCVEYSFTVLLLCYFPYLIFRPSMVARFDFWVTIFERLEHHRYQSIRISDVAGVLEKDESSKLGTSPQDLSYHSNEMTPYPGLHNTEKLAIVYNFANKTSGSRIWHSYPNDGKILKKSRKAFSKKLKRIRTFFWYFRKQFTVGVTWAKYEEIRNFTTVISFSIFRGKWLSSSFLHSRDSMTSELYHNLVGLFFLKISNILTFTIKKASVLSQPFIFKLIFSLNGKTNKKEKPKDYVLEAQRGINQVVFFFSKSLTH